MLEQIACGRMGMAVMSFYELTPRQFSNILEGYQKQENERERGAWERMRFSTTALINVQLEKGKKITPEQLCRFDWDKEAPKKNMTAEQFIKAFDIKEK